MKVDYKNRSIINPSPFGLSFKEGQTKYRFGEIVPGLEKGVKQILLDSTFKVFNVYNDMSVELIADDSLGVNYKVLFRLYEEGFGFKYILTEEIPTQFLQTSTPDSSQHLHLSRAISLELANDINPLERANILADSTEFEQVFKRIDDQVFVGIEPIYFSLFENLSNSGKPFPFEWTKTDASTYESQWIVLTVDYLNTSRSREILRAKLRQN